KSEAEQNRRGGHAVGHADRPVDKLRREADGDEEDEVIDHVDSRMNLPALEASLSSDREAQQATLFRRRDISEGDTNANIPPAENMHRGSTRKRRGSHP